MKDACANSAHGGQAREQRPPELKTRLLDLILRFESLRRYQQKQELFLNGPVSRVRAAQAP
jgi:hypothetical protein